jgi:hypothetical protein
MTENNSAKTAIFLDLNRGLCPLNHFIDPLKKLAVWFFESSSTCPEQIGFAP